VRRGDIVIVAGGPGYAGKPRPAVVMQADPFQETDSVTVCLMTTTDIGTSIVRIPVAPSATNKLRAPSWVMIDKVMTFERRKVGGRLGAIETARLVEVEARLAVFLGLA